ncbi:MAG: FliM/FliN family flagellar motor switch protein [Planctomycetia bacterium]|nr:FliM/FliN family flagellar motor switch protein [Planctomycetia bacterium]
MDDFGRLDPAAASDSQSAPGAPTTHLSNRNLLRIKVPVTVTMASKSQTVGKIVKIVPGSILQFNKPYDETLDLEVGTRRIAQGECVKMGDKWGFRIRSLILPAERRIG